MFQIYGIPTQNTLKALYIAEDLGLDYQFTPVDLPNGAHKKPDFLEINPIGKVPALKHGSFTLSESGAIARYLANESNSPLYPTEAKQRAQVDQWLDFFSMHLGRWLSTLFFEKKIKQVFKLGDQDPKKCEEAEGFSHQFLKNVEHQLADNPYIAGKTFTIADLGAFAYLEQTVAISFDLREYPNVANWLEKTHARPSITKVKERFPSPF